jgi:mannose-1-phosphate guanylyltransferase
MIIVIIAGGSGTRLWPLSTKSYPKHLLKLTNAKSLLQNTLARATKATSLDNIFVIPEASHVEHVYKQLEELNKENVLVEPGRRGTASCVIYALSEIKKRNLPNEPILFLWADHLIEDDDAFSAIVLKAGEIAETEQKLVFIGVKPTYPATGFGYLECGDLAKNWQEVYKLASFKEKPNQETADKYFASGKYLWNTGYLVGTLAVFERELQAKSQQLWANYQKLLGAKEIDDIYLGFESEPIDTALSEKVQDGLVVPGTFDWVDVGSFHDLHEVCTKDEVGNHATGKGIFVEGATNSFIRNETDIPVAVIGLDNVVVVSTPNGVLVASKDSAQKVGDVAKKIQS